MLLLRALLLWALVSVHVLGGAVLFRRLFGREAAWFGFIVPALAFCIGLNFIEHFVALPSLRALLPFTTAGSLLLLARPDFAWRIGRGGAAMVPAAGGEKAAAWRDLRLPAGIFLGSFAFTFLIRCLDPEVLATSDGLADLNVIANFCHGETLPPTDGWMPPFKLDHYYTFQHYAASVLIRLLGLDIGTGDNLSHALLAAFISFVAAATAWRITGRAWIALLMPILIEGAATGSSAYLLLTENDPIPWTMNNLTSGLDHPDGNPIWRLLATDPYRQRIELQVPGIWTWRDEYHANIGGHFLALGAVWILVELLRSARLNWPWSGAVLVPLLTAVTSAWALPLTVLLCGGGLAAAWRGGRRPENVWFVGGAIAVGAICLGPAVWTLCATPISPPVTWNRPEWRTPLYEFLIQWWPVLVLWLALFAGWRQLPPSIRWAHAVVPLTLIGIECLDLEVDRYNTVEKLWGYTFGVGLVAYFPVVAARRGLGNRLVTGLVVSSSVIALAGWLHTTFQWANWRQDAGHLEGNGILRLDPQRARLLQAISPLHQATLLTGQVAGGYNDSPALAVFSGNRTYIAWTWAEFNYGHGGENNLRAKQVNSFYAGTMAARWRSWTATISPRSSSGPTTPFPTTGSRSSSSSWPRAIPMSIAAATVRTTPASSSSVRCRLPRTREGRAAPLAGTRKCPVARFAQAHP